MQLQLKFLPATEQSLCCFVAFLAKDNISHNSIKVYLAVVRQLHLGAGYPPPDMGTMPRLHQVLRGIKITQSTTSTPRQSTPMTTKILRKIKTTWESRKLISQDKIMLWVAFLSFFGFMRSGELCGKENILGKQTADFNYQDVVVDSISNTKCIQLTLKKSKTDVFQLGLTIYLGQMGDEICPVVALLTWMVRRESHSGPLFTFGSGKVLTHVAFVTKLREALAEAGLDPTGFSRHSFHAGAVTTAATQGIADSHINQLGHWKSAAYPRYIRPPPQQLASLSKVLAQTLTSAQVGSQAQQL